MYSSPLNFNGLDQVTVTLSSYYEPENTVQRTLSIRVKSRDDRSTIRVRGSPCSVDQTLPSPVSIDEDTIWRLLDDVVVSDSDGAASTMSITLSK